jgi:hypothetical protein
VLFATAAEPGWSNWPLHQSFPAVMVEAALLAASGRAAERNLRVGQPLIHAFPPSLAGAAATIRRPDASPAATRLEAEGDISLLRYDLTDLAGVYRATLGEPANRELSFAANTDPAESDPAKLDATSLRGAVPGWDFQYYNDWKPATADVSAVSRRGELHRPLLWAVLALLFIESILAWRFGHHAPRVRTA